MRLDVLEPNALGGSNRREGAHLVNDEVLDFLRGGRHVSAAEAHEVRESRVRTDGDTILTATLNEGKSGWSIKKFKSRF